MDSSLSLMLQCVLFSFLDPKIWTLLLPLSSRPLVEVWDFLIWEPDTRTKIVPILMLFLSIRHSAVAFDPPAFVFFSERKRALSSFENMFFEGLLEPLFQKWILPGKMALKYMYIPNSWCWVMTITSYWSQHALAGALFFH